jgi:peptidoglycan/xylan/chitin deacetylase (PgdA/CDA1 family)
MATLFAVTIDTEEQWDWNAGWPAGSYSLENIKVLPRFEQLCARHGARTTWFTSGSVMDHGPSRAIVLEIAARPGVELGMHIHPWLAPPRDPDMERQARGSYLHNYPADQIHAKLASVHALFEKEGQRPTSFRGGRYSSGGAIHEFLLSKGFVADSSVVPFTAWPNDGAPDYSGRDLRPQRIAHPPHTHGLWEIPLTLGFTRGNFRRWAAWFRRLGGPIMRHLRIIGILGRLGVVKRVWLNFEDSSAGDMLALLHVLRPLQLPFVIFTVHSSSLAVGGNPYSATEDRVARIWRAAAQVLRTLESWDDFEPATVSEIAEALEKQHQCPQMVPPHAQLEPVRAIPHFAERSTSCPQP